MEQPRASNIKTGTIDIWLQNDWLVPPVLPLSGPHKQGVGSDRLQCGRKNAGRTVFISRAFGRRLHEDFFGRAFEVFEQGRTQPSFHFPLWPAIPIASVFGSSPNESGGVAWKGSCREDDFESDQTRAREKIARFF